MHYNQVLVVDKSGTPRGWTGLEKDACKYYAEDMVICDLGTPIYTFRGGKNADGEISTIVINSIIMVTGPVLDRDFEKRTTIYADSEMLYNRDCNMCAYCGIVFKDHQLSADHILPRSMGGKFTWTNMVTACKSCNHAKRNRTPEEAGMQLLYVPYVPSFQEKLLLEKRRVLADQMEYLKAKIPKTSRVWKNPHYN